MSNKYPHPFNKLADNWKKLFKELPIIVSNIAMNEFKENFRRQGIENKSGKLQKWKPRKGEIKGGIAMISSKSKGSRPILVKRGILKRSFKPKPSFGRAKVINDAPHAKANNEGFKGTVSVKSHTRRSFKKAQEGTGVYSVKTRSEKMRSVKKVSGQKKVKSFKRKMDLPARPFMETTPSLMAAIEKKVEERLKKIFK